jgi:methionyl aminopeptidase
MQQQRKKIRLKNPAQVERMRAAGALVADILTRAAAMAQPGVTTGEIDRFVESEFAKRNARPLFKGYPGKVPFPASTCISVNEEVVHGVPGPRQLREGDIVSIDTGCSLDGWCGDSAVTVPVGKISPDKQRLLKCAEETLELAIRELGKARKWSQVAQKMQDHVHGYGFSVVEQFVGHGIGEEMHELPQVPNFISRSWMREDFWLDTGLVICIEPMVNMGSKKVKVRASDQWTVETGDRLPSVHVEHMVAITPGGVEVLTARPRYAS